MDPVRVLLVADDPLARAGLAARLAGRDDIAIVPDGEPGVEAGAAVALWDLGISGAPEPRAAPAGLPSVALTRGEDDAADALRAGARAVLSRAASDDAIAAALVAVARGLEVLDPAVADGWVRPPADAPAEGLTARETEVLGLLAEGLGNKAIAARLGISEHTAKFHVNAILAKLGAESRAAAIVKAARLGLVAL
jgi:DNA-binding NarL/FixJ family response regulator